MFKRVIVGMVTGILAFIPVVYAARQQPAITGQMVSETVKFFCGTGFVSTYLRSTGIDEGASILLDAVMLSEQEHRMNVRFPALSRKKKIKFLATHEKELILLRKRLSRPDQLIVVFNAHKPKLMESLSFCTVKTLEMIRAELERMYPFFAGTVPEDQMMFVKLGADVEAEMRAGIRRPSEVFSIQRELEKTYGVSAKDIRTASWVEQRRRENTKIPEIYGLLIQEMSLEIKHLIEGRR